MRTALIIGEAKAFAAVVRFSERVSHKCGICLRMRGCERLRQSGITYADPQVGCLVYASGETAISNAATSLTIAPMRIEKTHPPHTYLVHSECHRSIRIDSPEIPFIDIVVSNTLATGCDTEVMHPLYAVHPFASPQGK